MNGGISDTNTTPTGQTGDPAALLSMLMASAASTSPSATGPGIGDAPLDTEPPTSPHPPGTTPPVVVEPPTSPPTVPPSVPPAVPPVGPPRPTIPAGEGSVNADARKRGEMLAAFLASFQAAYRRNNPNFNFTRNPRLAKSLGLPFSGDVGR